MKVTTSCSGRFWTFDQALQLQRHAVLHRLINDYPKSVTRRWGIPDEKTISLLANGVLARMSRHTRGFFGSSLQERFVRHLHDSFSRRLANHLPPDSDVFIGLSSFCLQAIESAKGYGQIAVVDHGSLHQRTERRLLEEEGHLHGLSMSSDLAPEWIIEKEDLEFHAADRVMVLSQAAKHSLIEEGVAHGKIFVNPCGVDLTQFFPPEKRENGIFRVIYCGNLSLQKGVHYLLQAFCELDIVDSELWLIGSGPKPSLARLISKYRSDKVRFLGTFPQNELRQIYAKGSVFVLPSLADGFGMVVSQAMACGLPVIVTENVGAADMIQDGISGFVVPIRDVEALKDRLVRLYEDSILRRKMGQSAHDTVFGGHTWDDYGNRLVTALRGFVGEAG